MSQGAEKRTTAGVEDDLSSFKELLSEVRFRIRLDDQVNATARATLARMSDKTFTLNTSTINGEDFAARLTAYEEAVRMLQSEAALLGKWALPEQLPTLTSMLARVAEHCADQRSGQSLWLHLQLYPLSLLLYSVGIASLVVENYHAFAASHLKRVRARARSGGDGSVALVVPVVDAALEIARSDIWRCLAEYKDKRVPQSEYLFKTLRSVMDELLFLGASYENLFDRYEILRSLMYADVTDGGWGPIGRFGWKFSGGGADNPYATLRAEADQQKDRWGPLQAGMFRGSHARFNEVATQFEKAVLQRLQWS